MSFKDKIDLKKLPNHIAIIMDGNGRWAERQGKNRIFGHKNGVKSVRETTEAAAELGVNFLTLYAFSTENWNRPKFEVAALMRLLVQTIDKETKTLNKNNIRLQAIGDLKSLHKNSYEQLMKAIKDTEKNDRMTLILALSYSSRWEIVKATKTIIEQIKNNKISIDDIDQKVFSSFLTTSSIPDPELLIRTSGE
ncbi:MAG: di-trans,poly-cis-decaprenylcistransferase, partial [Bacteroidales bacterium]|nr:di-trans,poly-cis-decaprenylcistransferase [Bacteroidales bacterium]